MASPIRRLVQLILDKAAAARMKSDAKGALGGVEKSLERLKTLAKSVGAALAGVFAVGKILQFGRAAIEEAARGEREWSKLGNTLRAVGKDADAMRAGIEASAQAFQAATTYGAGDYLTTLDRMIALTGDVTASTNNMGLVANVAAQFFDGELAPAADLVAKAMNGNVAALQKMGITAEDAQGALEILAERSMGAAEARARTFSGRVSILTELWNDFLDGVGNAILQSEGAGKALNVLTAAVRFLTKWVIDNQETLREWVTKGVNVAITAADALLRTVLGLADLFQGGFKAAVGVAAVGVSYLARGYALAYEAAAKFLGLIGADKTAESLEDSARVMRDMASSIEAWGRGAINAGGQNVARGLERFTRPLFTAGQFSDRPSTEGRGSLEVNAPQMSEAGAREELKSLEALNRKIIELNKHRTTEFEKLTKRRLKLIGMETAALDTQAAAAKTLVEGIAAAWAGGLGPFARQKARQNLLEGSELAIRATLAALTGFGAKQAAVFSLGAKQHFALAAAWGGLAAGVGGGASSAIAGGGLTAAQGATGEASRTAQPGADVKIYLTGPGFSALNPEVQRVVRGALDEDTTRRGNVRVRIFTDSDGRGDA